MVIHCKCPVVPLSMAKLSSTYYRQDDVVFIAQDLIGKTIVSFIEGKRTSGLITETEAYRGKGDKACHAHLGRFTERTKVMYEPGGVAYVYLCYGIHHLFNIITGKSGQADAVLIRAVEPIDGIATMLDRRGKVKVDKTLTTGPGNFTKAFGIDRSHYGVSLLENSVWIEDGLSNTRQPPVNNSQIVTSKRIGIDYAGEDKHLPWRFYLSSTKFVSKR